MNLKKYQSVYITLSDGRVGLFSGPELVTQKDQKKGIGVADIKFTRSKDLPPDISFENINEQKEKTI